MFKFIHGADLHLDSPFRSLPPEQAAERRRELRTLPDRLADAVQENGADLVLLAGDLLDGQQVYRETAEQLKAALERMAVPVFIAPGNHDWYGPESLWERTEWPENVRIFTAGTMETVAVPGLPAAVSGAAFTGPAQERSLLRGFRAPRDGRVQLGLLHGELDPAEARYDPISRQDAAESGLAYLALGHIHQRGAVRCGDTLCGWPGCPEGRGFDELGDKGVYLGTVSGGSVSLAFLPLARRRYMSLEADVTGRDPLTAAERLLTAEHREDFVRLTLTGETGPEGVALDALTRALAGRVHSLELRDGTRPARDLWQGMEEDSLRGLFLREMHRRIAEADTEEARAAARLAVRFGLAALDRRDLG